MQNQTVLVLEGKDIKFPLKSIFSNRTTGTSEGNTLSKYKEMSSFVKRIYGKYGVSNLIDNPDTYIGIYSDLDGKDEILLGTIGLLRRSKSKNDDDETPPQKYTGWLPTEKFVGNENILLKEKLNVPFEKVFEVTKFAVHPGITEESGLKRYIYIGLFFSLYRLARFHPFSYEYCIFSTRSKLASKIKNDYGLPISDLYSVKILNDSVPQELRPMIFGGQDKYLPFGLNMDATRNVIDDLKEGTNGHLWCFTSEEPARK